MFGKKKNRLGFQPKVRTKDEIDREYTHHAIQAGHKGCIIIQLQKELDEHMERLIELNAEGMKLPPTPPAAVAPTPEQPKTEEKGECA